MTSTHQNAGQATAPGTAASTGTVILPDVGEGLTEAEIVTWLVAVGDTVAVNDILVEIETAKSLVELPCPFEGAVQEILVPEGKTIPVGTPIVSIGTENPPGPVPDPDAAPATGVLVGYGPSAAVKKRRRRRQPPPGDAPGERGQAAASVAPRPQATPLVRKLAKDLGVDLAAITPSGKDGRITRADLLGRAGAADPAVQARPADPGAGESRLPAPGHAATRVPATGVQRAMAAAMTASAFTAPHVTEFLTADVTRSVRLVEKLKGSRAFDGGRVTFLLLAAKALVAACREFPSVNASWDGERDEIVLHRQVNLGIAAATPRGLVVPNIKNADALSLPALAQALAALVGKARDGKAAPEDMTGGTVTITNIGVFGVDAGTPILNPGEAAILCLGAIRRTPWEHHGKVALR